MTPWEIVQAASGPLGRTWLYMVMGATPHLPEGGGNAPDGGWFEYHPAKGVRIATEPGDRTTPFTTWRRLEDALRERVDPEPLRPAWDAYQAAWRAYLDVNDEWLRRYQRETVPQDLQDRIDDAHRLQWRTEQAALTQLRAALADTGPVDLLDMLAVES